LSYGCIQPDVFQQIGMCTGRILKGEKPGDLPVIAIIKKSRRRAQVS
jgi:ABC-type uncharacterized transport system substrate-binding protein